MDGTDDKIYQWSLAVPYVLGRGVTAMVYDGVSSSLTSSDPSLRGFDFTPEVQQQISTIGGGGETRLQYLDDIVGIATNLNAYDGMVLQVDVNGPAGKKFKFGNLQFLLLQHQL